MGDAIAVLKYLAPYVYRVAISNNRIESVDETHVQFRYTPSGTKVTKRRRVTGQEFVRGFLQHTLPPRFHRIRYYGFLNSHSSLSIDHVRMLVCSKAAVAHLGGRRNPHDADTRLPRTEEALSSMWWSWKCEAPGAPAISAQLQPCQPQSDVRVRQSASQARYRRADCRS